MTSQKDKVTIYEVAKAANVSLATVSRVINNKNSVKEKTRLRVEETIKKLDYQPSSLAVGLATSRTTNLAVLLPAETYLYISNILEGVIDVGRIYGYRTTVFSFDNLSDAYHDIIASRCDGAIIFNNLITSQDLQHLVKHNIPAIVIGDRITDEKVGSVEVDFIAPFKKVIRSYLKKGITDIAYIRYDKDKKHFFHNVTEALQSVYAEYGLKFDNYIDIANSYHQSYEMFNDSFKKGEKIHQVYIAPRDSLAMAVTNAAVENGIKVPEQMEVLAVISTKYSDIARPTISAIDVDMYEVGSVAARMLTKMLDGNSKNRTFRISARFIHRDSTKGE